MKTQPSKIFASLQLPTSGLDPVRPVSKELKQLLCTIKTDTTSPHYDPNFQAAYGKKGTMERLSTTSEKGLYNAMSTDAGKCVLRAVKESALLQNLLSYDSTKTELRLENVTEEDKDGNIVVKLREYVAGTESKQGQFIFVVNHVNKFCGIHKMTIKEIISSYRPVDRIDNKPNFTKEQAEALLRANLGDTKATIMFEKSVMSHFNMDDKPEIDRAELNYVFQVFIEGAENKDPQHYRIYFGAVVGKVISEQNLMHFLWSGTRPEQLQETLVVHDLEREEADKLDERLLTATALFEKDAETKGFLFGPKPGDFSGAFTLPLTGVKPDANTLETNTLNLQWGQKRKPPGPLPRGSKGFIFDPVADPVKFSCAQNAALILLAQQVLKGLGVTDKGVYVKLTDRKPFLKNNAGWSRDSEGKGTVEIGEGDDRFLRQDMDKDPTVVVHEYGGHQGNDERSNGNCSGTLHDGMADFVCLMIILLYARKFGFKVTKDFVTKQFQYKIGGYATVDGAGLRNLLDFNQVKEDTGDVHIDGLRAVIPLVHLFMHFVSEKYTNADDLVDAALIEEMIGYWDHALTTMAPQNGYEDVLRAAIAKNKQSRGGKDVELIKELYAKARVVDDRSLETAEQFLALLNSAA